jgi:hypothetical protein
MLKTKRLSRAKLHRHEGQTRNGFRRNFLGSLWSALQTHLQGVDRAMLAILPEKIQHRTALLSRLSGAEN